MEATDDRIEISVGSLLESASDKAIRWLINFAQMGAEKLESEDPFAALLFLDGEFDNLTGAYESVAASDTLGGMEQTLSLVGALSQYLLSRGLYQKLASWTDRAITISEMMDHSPYRFLLVHAEAKRRLGDWNCATSDLERAMAECRADARRRGEVLFALGRLQLNQGDYATGVENLERCRSDSTGAEHDPLLEIAIEEEVAGFRMNHGDLDQALELFLKSYNRRKEHGRLLGIEVSLVHIGVINRKQRRYEVAGKALEECREIASRMGDPNGLAWSKHHLGWVYLNQGAYEDAMKSCVESLALYRELGDIRGIADCLEQRGLIQLAQGHYDDAVVDLNASLEIRSQIENRHGVASSLRHIATARFIRREYLAAIQMLFSSLRLYRSIGVLNRERILKFSYEFYDWTMGRKRWTY